MGLFSSSKRTNSTTSNVSNTDIKNDTQTVTDQRDVSGSDNIVDGNLDLSNSSGNTVTTSDFGSVLAAIDFAKGTDEKNLDAIKSISDLSFSNLDTLSDGTFEILDAVGKRQSESSQAFLNSGLSLLDNTLNSNDRINAQFLELANQNSQSVHDSIESANKSIVEQAQKTNDLISQNSQSETKNSFDSLVRNVGLAAIAIVALITIPRAFSK